MVQGLLLVDKPAGWTSFDVVNYVRRIVAAIEVKKPKNVKVGHCGTLDPFATGLLILLIGKEYTKRAGEFSKLDKTYDFTMRLGSISSTDDPEGEITHSSDSITSAADINEAVKKFVGEIQQVPPIYSAIKVDGQRAYKLARKGKEVVMEPRKVTINRLEVVDYTYPDLKLKVDVTSGTYIRSLVRDIGEYLGTSAYTVSLRRTHINNFNVKQAIDPKSISVYTIEQLITCLTE